MAEDTKGPSGPDLAQGVLTTELAEGSMLAGHVGDEQILLAHRGGEFFAVGAHCTHYHALLADGLLVGDEVRCPWHHARFDLRTGEAVAAPALSPIACWRVEQEGDRIVVREKRAVRASKGRLGVAATPPGQIVIVGGGAAGFAAAEMLRRCDYDGNIVMISEEAAAPVDRPNLSKDYLAGTAQQDWVPLRPDSFYADNRIELRLASRVARLDARLREVTLADGSSLAYDRLLLATGAEPLRLPIPGADQPHVKTLRSLADCEAIIARAADARRVVVLGASFIGLEVAAALRTRGIDVHVVAPEARPMERVMGAQIGDFIRSLHEAHGVVFHLGETPVAIDGPQLNLKGGGSLSGDLIVLGVGVRPRLALAEQAGLAIDRGVTVNECLETSTPGIFAAGDIARWPDRSSGESIRVEHWVVAQRQGQTAARNMLGHREQFSAVPFFWSQHYDVPINYVGHAERWDDIVVDGDIRAKDFLARFMRNDRVTAVASVFRDRESLQAELAIERQLVA
jgi:apoptosis-inducing factor 3